MLGVQKRKKVSWARDGNLCQVRLFFTEDSPSQAGKGFQDHMQSKRKPFTSHCTGSVNHDYLPPGFQGVSAEAQQPSVKWKCPPRFVLDASWQVVAGEESEEVKIQNEREFRMLEEIYPQSSAIPKNPSISLDTKGSIYDDSKTPVIPVIPIEEDDTFMSSTPSNGSCLTSLSAQASYATTTTSVPNLPENGGLTSQPQLLAAASAMLSALAEGNELISHDFLSKVFSDPAKLTELVNNNRTEQKGKRIGTTVEMQDAKRIKMESEGFRGSPPQPPAPYS